MVLYLQIDYFPSRYDPVRHAERYPIPPAVLSGRREKVRILLSYLSYLDSLFTCP